MLKGIRGTMEELPAMEETNTMMKNVRKRVTVGLICASLAAAGCETTGQSTGLGAALGAGAGAIIGHQSGHAVEGALIGAAVGGLAGYAIGKTREANIAKRQAVEAEMRANGQAVPQTPTISIEELRSTPMKVAPGQTVNVEGTYLALGPSDEAPKGTVKLSKGGKAIAEAPLEVKSTGRTQFAKPIQMPKDATSGDYVVEVKMQHGSSTYAKETMFQVA
jgi:hypothetical protein